ALGGCSRLAGSSRVGTWVEITSASSATATMTTRITAPTTTVGWAATRQPGRRTAARAVMRASVATATSVIADARIDERVEDVHHQIDEHVGCCGHQHHALYDRIVTAQDG